MTAETTHKHSFPIQPPHGSIFGPGPCDCGKTYSRAQAEKQLAEALAAMDATEPADAPAGNRYETVASGSAGETTPGRAAYEAFRRAFPDEDWGPWEQLGNPLEGDPRPGWGDIAKAAIAAHIEANGCDPVDARLADAMAGKTPGQVFRETLHKRWAARGRPVDSRPWDALPEADRDDLEAAATLAALPPLPEKWAEPKAAPELAAEDDR